MKCPYKEFSECILNECPACNYETKEYIEYDGISPAYMSLDVAIKEGYKWEIKKKKYIFKSCNLIENSVQPVPKNETKIYNDTHTNVVVRRSIF